MSEENVLINIEDFAKVDLRVGIVESAADVSGTDKIIKLQVNLGTETRQILAGIRPHYTEESLVGKRIVVVTNLEPRKMRGEMSYGMLLATRFGDSLSLVTVDKEVDAGSKLG